MTNLKISSSNPNSVSGCVDEPENSRSALGGRMREAREAMNASRSEASTVVGVSLSTFQAWEAGDREPDATKLSIFASHYGLSVDWLLYGEGAMQRRKLGGAPENIAAAGQCGCRDTLGNPVDLEEFVFVPRYNLQASAGYGATTDDEKPVFSMAFRRYWIVNYLRADPHDLSVISVKGDSMEGVLNDRDVILINRSDTQATGGLFVLRIDGDLVVKRVQRLPGALLKVTSANEAYEPFTVDINNPPSDFSVVGRVVWFGRQVA